MWVAVEDGTLLADLPLVDIVMEINPVLPRGASKGVMLSALSAGLALLSVLGGGTASRLLTTALGQAPGLTKSLLETGIPDSEIFQIGEIGDALGSVLAQLQMNLADTLDSSQRDFDTILALASNGSFIAFQPSLNASSTEIAKTLKTFVVSQALQANNVILTVARNFSVYDLSNRKFTQPDNQTMFPHNSWHVNCKIQPSPETYGICDNWWIDAATNNAYSLFKLDDMEKNYNELMNTMFQNGWTTGEDIFLGSQDCLDAWTVFFLVQPYPMLKNSEDYVSNSTRNPSHMQPYCFANLRVCEWDQTNDLRSKDGFEFYANESGCVFAWPNFCAEGRPFSVNSSGINGTSVDSFMYSQSNII